MKKLEGKTAIVTGASKGIGAAIAKALGAEGASVVVNYATSKEGADKVVAEIEKGGGKAIAIQANVSNREDVKKLISESVSAFGKLDVLVNNAGVYKFGPIESVSDEELQRQFGTNVFGLLNTIQEAVPHFGPEGGSIINVGSTITSRNPPATVIYTATKGAVNSITQVLANELAAKNIRVNSLNPGGVETEGAIAAGVIGGDFEKSLVAQTPMGRIGQPDDIAPVAVFLASPDSGWLTGEIMLVSGGMR